MANRREFLVGTGTLSILSLAGCTTLFSGSDEIQLEELVLGNGTDASIQTKVLVYVDGEVRYWQDHTVPPEDEQNRAGEVVISEPWMENRSEYEILIGYDDEVYESTSAEAHDQTGGAAESSPVTARFVVTGGGVASLTWRAED